MRKKWKERESEKGGGGEEGREEEDRKREAVGGWRGGERGDAEKEGRRRQNLKVRRSTVMTWYSNCCTIYW